MRGRGFRGRTSLIRCDGSVVLSAAGSAAQAAEEANQASKTELVIKIVRYFGGRIDQELSEAGFSAGERQAVATFVKGHAEMATAMASQESAASRWRTLHEGINHLMKDAEERR